MGDDMLKRVRVEVRRCQAAVDRGSPVDFWIRRLERARKNYEAAATILGMQEIALRARSQPTTDSGRRKPGGEP